MRLRVARKVLRPYCGMFYRDHTWWKAYRRNAKWERREALRDPERAARRSLARCAD